MESSPNKTQFNSLEKAVLQWFVERYKDENLSAQIKAAKIKERRWTKAGFYIDLDVPMDLAPIDKKWPVTGPEIKSEDLKDGGGALLWGKDGYITTIEMYTYGSLFKEDISNFELSKS